MFQTLFLIITLLFIGVVLLQQKNATLGSMMGGGGGDDIIQTRRGAEKFLHQTTIALAILFLGFGLYAMIVA
ncbi:preprotein translocase subunit SecG [Candidatus Gracilibacteria bacterium]|nr:preprotein translocase subunit SecG [Candidatus Gracilibacteria bacterium]MCF7819579.1 preprotein translocase subunit SecG [Candidatus Gracilibacteria bacterium]